METWLHQIPPIAAVELFPRAHGCGVHGTLAKEISVIPWRLTTHLQKMSSGNPVSVFTGPIFFYAGKLNVLSLQPEGQGQKSNTLNKTVREVQETHCFP